ncbi:hypothetical protein [uncultured Chryseobacterium sp.]|uniref:hypothetical protein n=1 Tax=uncultured Chryseobacterium sp. TaxID=259322 RepID=UPI0025D200F7|nr:hypothetical protein [uncultured Chryseobacterium sp.]
MRNVYNKGPFRGFEWGKIPPYLKKYGNKKWRRAGKSVIAEEINEKVRFLKSGKKRRKLIWVKITSEINGRTSSGYRRFYSEKSFKSSVSRAHVTRYFMMDKTKRKNDKEIL